jgi:hypothetical protein
MSMVSFQFKKNKILENRDLKARKQNPSMRKSVLYWSLRKDSVHQMYQLERKKFRITDLGNSTIFRKDKSLGCPAIK